MSSIAIIGMACEFPGAHSPEELWQNVLAGRRYFRKAPPERLPREYFDEDPTAVDKSYCDQMAVLEGWQFDPLEFRIPPVTFAASDIAHWLALYVARAAIRDAGLDLQTIDRTRMGVVLGNTLTGEFTRSHNLRNRWPYLERAVRRVLERNGHDQAHADALIVAIHESYCGPLPEITEDSLAGNMANTIAGRICGHFDLGGGGYTVDGACSSSLLALAQASDALVNGDLDIALVGGVDVSLDPFEIVGFAKAQALARDDIRPYDERAAGMLAGEGCGLFVLMREADARTAGHRIHAVVRGWGISSDGRGGITAPEVEGQMRALQRAYQRAGYPISTVGLIEGHGTGTALGDKVEITALQHLLEAAPAGQPCRIGSIKANIGHCKAAAGAAGLTKIIMALKRKLLPPTVNCTRPNALFSGPRAGRLVPSLTAQAWDTSGQPRRASVSSMGFGGANSHVTLEEANPDDTVSAEDSGLILSTSDPGGSASAWTDHSGGRRGDRPSKSRENESTLAEDLVLTGSAQSSEILLFSAPTIAQLKQRVEQLIPIAARICRAELTDLAAALAGTPPAGEYRIGIVADSPWNLAASLRFIVEQLSANADLAAIDDETRGIFAGRAKAAPALVALFPGQGSQRLNMGAHLPRRYPFVRDFYLECDDPASLSPSIQSGVGPPHSIGSHIFREVGAADKSTVGQWEDDLRHTRVAQPAIMLSSLAMARVLDFFGLKPTLSIGHSLGEIGALQAAGAFDAHTAIRLAALRGEAMGALSVDDAGAMLAIAAKPGEVEELILGARAAGPHPGIAGEPPALPLVISNYNSTRQTVVSGATGAIARLREICAGRSIRCQPLPVSHAFHSDIVAPAAAAFRAALEPVAFEPLAGGFISTSTGDEVVADADLKDLLAQQIARPVRFVEAVKNAAGRDPALWIEVGPGGVLTSFVRDILGPDSVHCLPTDLAGENGFHLLNQVLARAFVLGFPVRTDRLFAHRFHRPFNVENYNPVFIVNPCERPVTLSAAVEPTAASVPAALIPEGLNGKDLAGYLARRGSFLRDLIALDHRHHTGAETCGASSDGLVNSKPETQNPKPTHKSASKTGSVVQSTIIPGKESTADRVALLAFVIEWIAKRTGFPPSAIAPDKRLRDDLNLDSIKVGELVIHLSRKANRIVTGDVARVANARVGDVVESVLGDVETQPPPVAAAEARQMSFSSVPGLGEWTRTFRVESMPADIETESPRPLPSAGGTVAMIGDVECPKARAIADMLSSRGVIPIYPWSRGAPAAVIGKNAPGTPHSHKIFSNFDAIVVVLPLWEKPFYECSPDEFDARVDGSATELFQIFRAAVAHRPPEAKPLRGLILRPLPAGVDHAADGDAGAAFLKSLLLEYPDTEIKWAALPNSWSPEKWAATAARELEISGHVAVAYAFSGERLANAALPLHHQAVRTPVSTSRPPSLPHSAEERLGDVLGRLIEDCAEFRKAALRESESGERDRHFIQFEHCFFEALDHFSQLTRSLLPDETRRQQQRVYRALQPFVAESDAFRRILEKPLGYPGDHLLMEMICENSPAADGIGYHFDRLFFSQPGAEAVRQRTKWAVGKLESLLSKRTHLSVLDLGCGPMIIERTVAGTLAANQSFDVLGLDFDERALKHAQDRLVGLRVKVSTRKINLVSPEGLDQLGSLAGSADVCLCLGLIEYLEDETVVLLLKAINDACRSDTTILLANFKPDHFSRPAMEWYQDWWLVYRTEADMRRIAAAAGFTETRIRTSLDATSSLVLVELEK